MQHSHTILVLYYSAHGSNAELARLVCHGIEKVEGIEAKLRTVPTVSPTSEATTPAIPDQGPPYATLDDLSQSAGLVMGGPGRFGNMAAPLKYFLETTTPIWLAGGLVGKPAGVFTSTSSLHGGQEATLLSMMIPLFHHGMIMVGLPFTEIALSTTKTGGTPYGPTHVAGIDNQMPFSSEEKILATLLGQRVAILAKKLA